MRTNLIVAHYNEVFFARSETFIYHYISNFTQISPILIARTFENFEFFPYSKPDCYSLPIEFPQRRTPAWLSAKLSQKLFGTCFTGEEILCRQKRVKLIHAHFGPQGYFAVNWFEKKRIPVITNFYGFDVSELPNDPLWQRRFKILFELGRLFLVEGKFMKEKLFQIGCPKEKIQIQRIAIPLDKLTFRPRLPKSSQEKTVFIFCGRFVEKKGLAYIIDALAEIKESRSDFEFRVIGDGPLKEEIQQQVKERNLLKHVLFLGFLTYEKYIEELSKADIFIHPSVTSRTGDTEGGAPTVILEAQAMGLPVVATYHADIPNIVSPQQSALLSKERDIQGLTANILKILNNQDQWAQMGKAGRAFVEEFHDIKKEVVVLEKRYHETAL
ncbi:MAG: glycosyltransferase [Candidatus Omnitrophica bacterium]|nr:glycosyltransferase [Candidatus Omnitrophota bacterium]